MGLAALIDPSAPGGSPGAVQVDGQAAEQAGPAAEASNESPMLLDTTAAFLTGLELAGE